MKIGLIFPNKDRRYKTVHLGLGYLASYARTIHRDLEFQILDTRVATRKETNLFFKTSFNLIGITVFSPVYNEVVSIFKKIKYFDKNIPVCLGGPYVTTILEDVFSEVPADFGIYGEGEITFSDLIDYIKGNKNAYEINGLMHKSSDGSYIINPPREQIPDLDTLPMPAYDLFKMSRYPLHRILTSRGCPYTCSFCNSSSIWGGRWRARSAEKVFEEMVFLVSQYGKKNFGFNDNTFNIDNKKAEKLCDLLIENRTNMLWSTPVRAESISLSLAKKMKQAGCYNVTIGIESANNEILKNINKKATIEKISEGIINLKEAGIEVLGQFVIGSPHETLQNVKESVSFAKNSNLDYVNFYSILPFRGTSQWDYVKSEGIFYTETIHNFHSINPRIIFETKEFPYKDRLEALKLVTKEGFYSNHDKKSLLFDMAKSFSVTLHKYLPHALSNKIYLLLKCIYKVRIIKKNNS